MKPYGLATETCAPDKVPVPLFDEHGRCMPSGLTATAHARTRRYFICTQPEIDYGAIHARIKTHLGIADALTAAEFETRAEAIMQHLRNDPATAEMTRGVAVPFFLPQASYPDYGAALEHTYLEAVKNAFADKLPQYDFVNHHRDGLAGKLDIVRGSRHDKLVEAMRHQSVVGVFFPCLSEYSVPAAIEQTGKLPAQFMLAGGFDTCAALIGSPDLLLRTDGYPPLLWLAALAAEKEATGYHFEAYGYNLTFNRRPHFGQAAEYWASGLVVLD